MTIGSVNSTKQIFASETVAEKKKTNDNKDTNSASKRSDTLELSTASTSGNQPILSKIESGFYDKPEVLRSVAQKILKELE